ncbi:MAG: hypothetical protein AB3X41_02470 [Leptothrix ochracea]|uniref:hypothetical protein n=1 Tax=Leptothrix ochracea TaxID=735331 RepID=UPI0034E1B06C
MKKNVYASPEQLRYADILGRGTLIGLLGLVVLFGLYTMGWITPHVPLEQLPQLWNLPVRRYLAATGQAPGWDWLHLIHRGDVINLLGIAWLASVSFPALLAILIMSVRRGDRAFALMVALEMGVLALAASGIFGGPH